MEEPADPTGDHSAFLDDRAILTISAQLRGVAHVTLRMTGDDLGAEAELAALIRGLGLTLQIRRGVRILPPPVRRFSFQFTGDTAVLTVTPSAAADG